MCGIIVYMLCIYCCVEVKGCRTSNLWFQFLTRDSYHVGARVTCRRVGPMSLQAHTKSRSKSEWWLMTCLSFVVLRTCNHASYQLQFQLWWWKNSSHSHSRRILLLLDYPWFLFPIYKVLCVAIFVTEYMGEWPQAVVVRVYMYTPTYTHTTWVRI